MSSCTLQLEYANARNNIRIGVNLNHGLNLGRQSPSFEAFSLLPAGGDMSFRCQIALWFFKENEKTLSEKLSMLSASCVRGPLSFHLEKGKLWVEVPIENCSFEQKTQAGNPRFGLHEQVELHEFSHLSLREQIHRPRTNPLTSINFSIDLSIVKMGPRSMFVGDQREQFESGHVTSGGRPESNRRKF